MTIDESVTDEGKERENVEEKLGGRSVMPNSTESFNDAIIKSVAEIES